MANKLNIDNFRLINSSVFIGPSAGEAGGGSDVCIGNLAGQNGISAGNRIMIGSAAGFNATAGIIIGGSAGVSNTSSTSIFIGEGSGAQNTSATSNIAIGTNAGNSMDGINNIVIGTGAAFLMNTATNNVVIGTSAGSAITSSSSNVIIGRATASLLSTAQSNVIIGQGAASLFTTGSGGNVIIGSDAGDTLTTADSCIIIGAGANVASPTATTQLAFGGWLSGTSSETRSLRHFVMNNGIQMSRTNVNNTAHVANLAQCIIGYSALTAPRQVTLPTLVSGDAGATFIVADEVGAAGTHNITVAPASGTIDGVASILITVNYGVLRAYWTGTTYKTF